jgi:peptidyl-tRNA hydrolase
VLEKLQAMSTDLGTPPAEPHGDGLRYALNPRLEMSSGKVVAQVAHAAVMADWDGEAALYSPSREEFDALCERSDLAAKVVDAGLTEVPPGTVTVLAMIARG